MRKLSGVLCLVALIVAAPLQAANWSANVRIATIEISNVNEPGVWISFSQPPYPSHTCSAKNGQYMLGGGQPDVQQMTSAAIAAHTSGRQVSIYWGGACSGGGANGYPVILGLTVK